MCVIARQTKTERKRLAKSVCCTENPCGYSRMTPVNGLIRPNRHGCTTVAAVRSTERITRRLDQATFTSSDRPFGECRLEWRGLLAA